MPSPRATENPRCPCVLVLDTSACMAGRLIEGLYAGLVTFKDELATARGVDLAMVTFGPVVPFQSADAFQPPVLTASGDTPMGAGITLGLSMIRERKDEYRRNGIEYFRPWMFLIAGGAPTDAWYSAAHEIRVAENNRTLQFFCVGVGGANLEILRQISVREPLLLNELRFRDMFSWLAGSLQATSASRMGEHIPLTNPAAPGGWGSVG